MEYLKNIIPTEKWMAMFKESVLDVWEENGRTFDLQAQNYAKQLAGLEEKRKRIFEMREDGSYSKEEFQERKEQAENEIAATRISLSESRIEQFDIEGALAYAKQTIKDLPRLWFDLLKQIRPRFQKLVFPRGIPYKRDVELGTAELGLIFELNRQTTASNSTLVPSRGIEPRSTA